MRILILPLRTGYLILAVAAVLALGMATSDRADAAKASPWRDLRSSIEEVFSPPPRRRPMRRKAVKIAPAAAAAAAPAAAVPMPPERPPALGAKPGTVAALPAAEKNDTPVPTQAPPLPPEKAVIPAEPPPPSACRIRLTDIAAIKPLPAITGPGECAADDVLNLEAVRLKNGREVKLSPHATLRCEMAEAVTHWIRDDVTPAINQLGGALRSVSNAASFDCRGRNRVAGAKLSEHGRANALDIHGFTLTNGKEIALTEMSVEKEFRERVRDSVCARFTTVLGPGSDGYHESHIHLDIAERRGGYRMCQWDVRTEPAVADVPLPPEKPKDRASPATAAPRL